MNESAAAVGYSAVPPRNFAWITLPIMYWREVPRNWALMKSPTAGMNVSSEPGEDARQRQRHRDLAERGPARLAYRSVAASISRRSIFSSDTYSGSAMNGRKL